ncbi:MAG: molybdate ABC transporter substrate-binding protein [bacterium]
MIRSPGAPAKIVLSAAAVLALLVAAGCGGKGSGPKAPPKPALRAYVGTVLAPAFGEIVQRFESQTKLGVATVDGAASELAARIAKSDSCDVFFPGGDKWMDWLEQQGKVEKGTRREIVRGTLVLVAAKEHSFAFDPAGSVPLPQAFQGQLAILNPDRVPVGAVTKQALERAGWWGAFASRLQPTPDPKTLLSVVGRGKGAAGIVCASDVQGNPLVEVVAALPDTLYDPMTYPAAILAGHATPAARRFAEFLAGSEAGEILARHGFRLEKPGAPGAPGAPAK